MTGEDEQAAAARRWMKPVAILVVVFGGMTILSGGSVLFGPAGARQMAGDYLAFVVWFNFLAGFVYIAAGIGIWANRSWAGLLARVIAGATLLAAAGFAVAVLRGVPFEIRTLGALALRFALWAAIARSLGRPGRGA